MVFFFFFFIRDSKIICAEIFRKLWTLKINNELKHSVLNCTRVAGIISKRKIFTYSNLYLNEAAKFEFVSNKSFQNNPENFITKLPILVMPSNFLFLFSTVLKYKLLQAQKRKTCFLSDSPIIFYLRFAVLFFRFTVERFEKQKSRTRVGNSLRGENYNLTLASSRRSPGQSSANLITSRHCYPR